MHRFRPPGSQGRAVNRKIGSPAASPAGSPTTTENCGESITNPSADARTSTVKGTSPCGPYRTAKTDEPGADTSGDGVPVFVLNTLSWTRDAITSVTVTSAATGVRVADPDGRPVPAVTDSVVRNPDGSLEEITLTFLATAVPALGYRVYRVLDAADVPPGWTEKPGPPTIENDVFAVEADPARGGALKRVRDRRSGRDLLKDGGLAAGLVVQDEHAEHPVWGEGPWHLLPKGPGHGPGAAEVVVETSPVGERLVATRALDDLRITQRTTLWRGVSRVDVHTDVDGSLGQDRLLRARFDFAVPGALPVAEVGFGAIGRSFGFPDVDAAEHLWTLDTPAHTWAGLSATARVALVRDDGTRTAHAIGVAEVVEPLTSGLEVRALVAALAAKGVTATCTRPGGLRYGALDADSNLPDVRFVVGADNPCAAEVLASADSGYRDALKRHGRVFVPAIRTRREAWVPDADLRGLRDLPVVIVDDVKAAIAELRAAAALDVRVPDGLAGTAEPADSYSVAVVNHGTPGFVVDPGGTLHLSLMRSCSGWPSGGWIDGERRTAPDGSSFAWQHWTHTFGFSIVAGDGDWRDAGFPRHAQEAAHPLRTRPVPATEGVLPPALSLITVEPAEVVLTAAKPAGNPLASGSVIPPADAITLRVYESTGSAATAAIALHGGIRSAWRTDLLEERGEPVEVDAGRARVELGAADVATVRLEPVMRMGTGQEIATEPVQPFPTRYWLHNEGPAPAGNLPVSVHVTPTRLKLGDGRARLDVTVSCSGRPARGRVELDLPPGWRTEGEPDFDYDLAPGGHAKTTVEVRGPDTPGRYLLAARITDDRGHLLEDTAEILVGPPPPRDDLVAVGVTGAVVVRPGGCAELPVSLENLAQSEIRGAVAVISPFGTWGTEVTIGPRLQPFRLAAGETATVPVTVRASHRARPGAHWWVLVRVAAHGRLSYSPAVEVRIE